MRFLLIFLSGIGALSANPLPNQYSENTTENSGGNKKAPRHHNKSLGKKVFLFKMCFVFFVDFNKQN